MSRTVMGSSVESKKMIDGMMTTSKFLSALCKWNQGAPEVIEHGLCKIARLLKELLVVCEIG